MLVEVYGLSSGSDRAHAAPPGSPSFRKACGQIEALNTTLAVDIEGLRLPTTCRQARRVLSTYLARSQGSEGSLRVKLGSKVWDCYKSRPFGAGWDFNCGRIRPHFRKGPTRNNFVFIGAGRRF
jgi:hypothetical protein